MPQAPEDLLWAFGRQLLSFIHKSCKHLNSRFGLSHFDSTFIAAYSLGDMILIFCAWVKYGACASAGAAATSPTAKAAAKRTRAENLTNYSFCPFRQTSQSCSPKCHAPYAQRLSI